MDGRKTGLVELTRRFLLSFLAEANEALLLRDESKVAEKAGLMRLPVSAKCDTCNRSIITQMRLESSGE